MVVILADLVGGEAEPVVREMIVSEVWSLAVPTTAIHEIKEMTEGSLSVIFICAAFCSYEINLDPTRLELFDIESPS
jgi:hypothetical protein